MNQHLQNILNFIQQDESLTTEQKNAILKSLKEADKELEITTFKLDRTEKVKRTTAILLEETIEELEHKRKAVEAQNRELEIETALEKVRAVAMGMRQPEDMLDVCRIISQQLDLLNVREIRNVQTAIFNQQKGIYLNYEFFRLHDKTTITEVEYNLQPDIKDFVNQMLTDPEAFFTTAFEGAKLKDWMEYQEKANQFVDPHLYEVVSLHYYFYSIGPGALGVSTYAPLNDNELAVFKRFRNVFELAYRRFIDIEQALAQTREAQIEASLEKVRAGAMSMYKPGDLLSICEILFKEFHALGFGEMRNAMINIHNDDNKTFVNYDYSDEIGKSMTPLFYNTHPLIEKQIKEIRSADDAFSETVFEGKDLEEWKKFRTERGEKDDPRINNISGLYYYFYSIGTGSIGISTFGPINEQKLELLKRFRNVFNLAYQRYADIAQAEAQAREAKIEAALEKVRSRSLAMHNSSELKDVVKVVFEKLQELDFAIDGAAFILTYFEDAKDVNIWIGDNHAEYPTSFRIPYDEAPPIKDFWLAKESGADFFSKTYSFEEKNRWFNYAFEHTDVKNLAAELKSWILEQEFLTQSFALAKNSLIGIHFHHQKTLSDTEVDILKRFSKVFDQAYIRFLDLQKAEAQAREAKIEASLERVRSKTMAMHNSQDVGETVATMFDQLVYLGVTTNRCGILIFSNTNDTEVWTAKSSPTGEAALIIGHLDVMIHPMLQGVRHAWKSKETFYSNELAGDDIKNYYSAINNYPDYPTRFNLDSLPSKEIHSDFYFPEGAVFAFTSEAIAADDALIFKRFAGVFGQTYRRYLDLLKAEAQARDAQIEAALERVRAKVMAMNSSKDLNETSFVFGEQLRKLGIDWQFSYFWLIEEDKDENTFWITWPDNKTSTTTYSLAEAAESFKECIIAWKEQVKIHSTHVPIQDVQAWLHTFERILNDAGGVAVEIMKSDNFKDGVYYYDAMIRFGSFGILMNRAVNDEEKNIQSRFATEFERAYARFLDLQKAEAQARESQIQLALERARTQSMLMQYSKELDDTLRVFHEQVLPLGINSAFSFLWLPDEDKDRHIFWAAWAENNSKVFKSKAINYPLDRNEPATAQCLVDWKSNEPVASYHVPPAGVESYFAAWQELIAGVEQLKPGYFRDGLYYVEAFMKYGCFGVMVKSELPKDEKKILARFAIEFERAYTRFLDLQKAEAQARESQIQLALERVRARTMAMQHSDELKEAAALLFQQAKSLGVPAYTCGYNIWEKDEKEFTSWMSTQDGSIINGVPNIPLTEDANFIRYVKSKQRGEQFFVLELRGERMQEHYQYLKTIPAFKGYFDYAVSVGFDLPETQIHHLANFSQGNLLFITLEPCPEFHDVFKRFAAVFEQTYTRFLDLQKAEAQAREAQIEAALERVRSRSMAMYQSTEMNDVAIVLFQQLRQLGGNLLTCGIVLCEENSTVDNLRMAVVGGGIVPTIYIPNNEDPVHKNMYEGWKTGKELYTEARGGEELKAHYDYMMTVPSMRPVFENLNASGFPLPTWQKWHAAYFSHGYLLIITLEPYVEEQTLKRLAKVFEQTYTRFLDLQKAEAQARESQIQLALERVRARTMAMQRSDELMETAVVLFDQLNQLGEHIERTIIGVMNEEERVVDIWATRPDGSQMEKMQKFPIDEPILMQKVYVAWRQQRKSIVIDLQGEELEIYFQFLKSRGPRLKRESFGERRVENFAFFSKGMLGVISADPNTPANVGLYERFAAVFDQTYTRFLDLQKAEAQAREAKIEAALEKIRSRSLAMHQSSELKDVIIVVFEKLNELGLIFDGAGIYLFNDASRDSVLWVLAEIISKPLLINLPYDKEAFESSEIFKNLWEARKTGEDFYNKTYSFDEKNRYFEYVFKYNTQVPLSVREFQLQVPDFTHSVIMEKNSALMADSWSGKTFSIDELNVLKRVAKVFEQAYIRFLDLQKSEAQARESQIQLALERVRARTMAMQRSDELQDAASLMVQQIQTLGVPQFGSGFNIWDDDRKAATAWMCNVTTDNLPPPFKTSSSEDIFLHIYDAAQRGESLFVREQAGKELETHYRYMNSIPIFKEYVESASPEGLVIPEFQIMHCAFFSHGYLMFITYEHVPEAHDIFKRFAKVFEQTYTRFLDLQKAEAQAREAQIEAALERVRSRTMAMQHSTELSYTAALLFQQIKSLGVPPWSCGFNIWEPGDKVFTSYMGSPEGTILEGGKIPLTEEATFIHFQESRDRGDKLYIDVLEGERIETHYRYFQTLPGVKEIFERRAEAGFPLPTFQINHLANFSNGNLLFITYEPCPEAHDIFIRFAKVFEQTYTRFLDLQKAEAQARESQIQLAMERVRARTMAMQRSDELADVSTILFQQVKALGVPQWTCGFNIWEIGDMDYTFYPGNPDGHVLTPLRIPLTGHWVFSKMDESRKRGEEFYMYEKEGEKQEEHYRYMMTLPGLRELLQSMLDAGLQFPIFQIDHFANFSHGNLMFITYEQVPEMHDVFKRFAKVFEQTYTRFLDLQKAEAQAREAQIEAALERVRSRTMAMQKSDELAETSSLLDKQVRALGIQTVGCAFNIYDEGQPSSTEWFSNLDGNIGTYKTPREGIFLRYYEKGQQGETLHVDEITGDACVAHYEYLSALPGIGDALNKLKESGIPLPSSQIDHVAYFKYGYLLFITFEPVPEAHDIFKRFAKVFEQTYTRFLDLQKAEAQAREAQIEAALEKVRSRSMGMQKSEELKEVIQVVYEQFVHLNIQVEHTGFIMDYKERDDMHIWLADKHAVPFQVTIPYFDCAHWNSFNEAKEKGTDFFANHLSFEEKNKFYQDLFKLIPGVPEETLEYYFSCPGLAISTVLLENVGLYIENFSGIPYTDEENATLMRFGKVFQQTYTRFLDLEKAEAQAREAQIETALERVRSRSMGMQKSDELRQIIQVIYEQFIHLGIKIDSAGFAMDYMESDDFNFWFADSYSTFPNKVHIPYLDHPQFNRFKEAKEKGLDFYTSNLTFEEKNKFFDHFLKDDPPIPQELREVFYSAPGYISSHVVLKNIVLYILNYTDIPFSDAENATLIRFGKVFEQTYIRFNDLKQAEAQALEAIKRASVDRVRAEIASMRTTSDLERIQPLIWNELKTLGVPFIRCGVFIMDEEKQEVQTMLSTPEGKAIATLHVPFEFDLTIITRGVQYWRKKEVYKEHWDAAAFTKAWHKLSSLRGTSMDAPQAEHPPESLYLHLLPFLQGMLYVGNETPLNDEELQLVQNLADAFSTAYARYEDFNRLEAAKKQVDSTLNELQVTQKQLIQSEKMASLGELTAGIAHEIQNPLNFVNNFSEVSTELLDEMITELGNDNKEDAIAIADDVKQNLEKILHHGKRADGIVKGMLQHSRSSSAIKEPTDINNLADEYLRLAYHGLRAKDKTFNAKFETDFDNSIGHINIIPQDIGRVLVNLINNAFYAVTEKRKKDIDGYEPTVTITTKKIADKPDSYRVELKVIDNGNGISQKVLDKIFQPFFTTKPTGQGTGLGLSLSYDIIKAHAGEIKVETKEGEGTEFIIQLPVV